MGLSNLLARLGSLSLWAHTGREGAPDAMGDPSGPSIQVNPSPLYLPVAVSSMSAHTKSLQTLPRLRTKPGLGAKWSVRGEGARPSRDLLQVRLIQSREQFDCWLVGSLPGTVSSVGSSAAVIWAPSHTPLLEEDSVDHLVKILTSPFAAPKGTLCPPGLHSMFFPLFLTIIFFPVLKFSWCSLIFSGSTPPCLPGQFHPPSRFTCPSWSS